MQSSHDALTRAIHSLPKTPQTPDHCIACSGLHSPELHNAESQPQFETIAQLRQALHFETLLRQITEKLHSLDQPQILQAAVRELTAELGLKGCNLGLYDVSAGHSTLCSECWFPEHPVALSQVILFSSQPELYQQLLQGQTVQFCRAQATCLACPIFDGESQLGDLWLFKPRTQCFSPQEI